MLWWGWSRRMQSMQNRKFHFPFARLADVDDHRRCRHRYYYYYYSSPSGPTPIIYRKSVYFFHLIALSREDSINWHSNYIAVKHWVTAIEWTWEQMNKILHTLGVGPEHCATHSRHYEFKIFHVSCFNRLRVPMRSLIYVYIWVSAYSHFYDDYYYACDDDGGGGGAVKTMTCFSIACLRKLILGLQSAQCTCDGS